MSATQTLVQSPPMKTLSQTALNNADSLPLKFSVHRSQSDSRFVILNQLLELNQKKFEIMEPIQSVDVEKKEANDMINLTESDPSSTSNIEKKNEEDSEDLFTDQHTALVQYKKYCHLKARVSDYIDLFNKKFAKEKDVDYDDLYEDLSMEREFAINKLDRKWGSDEVLFTELRQLPLHKKIIEYYKDYQLDFFEVEDIQQLRNYMKVSNVKYLEPSEVQEQIKKDILQCAFERGDSYVIRDVKAKLLEVLKVFDEIKL